VLVGLWWPGGGALGCGGLAIDLGLVSVVGRAPAPRGLVEALEAVAFAGLGGAFAFVRSVLAVIGLAVALVGDALSFVGDAVPVVRHPLARVGPTFTPGDIVLAPLEFGLAGVFVLGRVCVRGPEHAVKCSTLFSRERGGGRVQPGRSSVASGKRIPTSPP
jgi:hypothetical protein